MKYLSKETGSQTAVHSKQQIDWNDFNYPVCLKIYHYNSEETPQIHKRKVGLLRANHTLILIANFLNIITNIIGAAQGGPDGGLRVGISIFLFFFWIPLSFISFFLPYHIIMKDDGKPLFFYLLSFLISLWFAIWCIADFADANGFVMVGRHFVTGRGAAGVFALITSLLMLLIAILGPVNAVLFSRR